MTKTVIILILTTLFILPLFEYQTYISATPSFDIGLEMVVDAKDDSGVASTEFKSSYDEYVDWHTKLDIPLVYLEIEGYGTIWEESPDRYKDLRSQEIETAFASDGNSKAYWDISLLNKYESILNISRTLLVCLLLGLGSYWFNRDATSLVLDPLERMIERVQIVSKEPMALISVEEIEKASMLNMEKKAKEKKTTKEQRKQKEAENETFFLEKSLFKIGKLLGLCYG